MFMGCNEKIKVQSAVKIDASFYCSLDLCGQGTKQVYISKDFIIKLLILQNVAN